MLGQIIDQQQKGVTRAVADDIACAFESMLDLTSVFQVFNKAEIFAGLVVKPRKCHIIPFSRKLTMHLQECLCSWLVVRIPQWARFNVSSSALYLGVHVGPTANMNNWLEQIQKYMSRVLVIAQSGLYVAASAVLYNVFAVSVLQYAAQMLPLPMNWKVFEKAALHRLFHAPRNLFGPFPFVEIERWVGVKFASIECTHLASQTRFFLSYQVQIQDMVRQLNIAARGQPISVEIQQQYAPAFWSSPSIVHTLEASFFRCQACLDDGVNCTIAASSSNKTQSVITSHLRPLLHPPCLAWAWICLLRHLLKKLQICYFLLGSKLVVLRVILAPNWWS